MRLSSHMTNSVAQGLGWFSIGLGLAQLTAPGYVAGLSGIETTTNTKRLMRGLGVREITSGVGILAQRNHQRGWLVSRVIGDVMDVALLVAAARSMASNRKRVIAATAAVVGILVLDALTAKAQGSTATAG